MNINNICTIDDPLFEMVVIPDDVDYDDLIFMLDAAKRGLGFANKIRDPIQRKRHAKAVLVNLNKIRGALTRLINDNTEEVV